MEILVQQAEWLAPSTIHNETNIPITDSTTMGEIESICQQQLKDKFQIKEGCLTYSNTTKPDYNKLSLALWILDSTRPLFYYFTKKEEDIAYSTISKYTFYDNEDQWVKVLLDLPKIGEIDKSNIKAEF